MSLKNEMKELRIENKRLKADIFSFEDKYENIKILKKKFQDFFEDDLTGDFISDGNGKVLDCNKSFLEIFGFGDKSEILGKEISIIYKSKSEFELIKEELRKKRVIKGLEAERLRKDRKPITVIINLVATINDQGDITEIKGYLFDISKRKYLETELLKAKEKAEESDRLKSAFLANMSHEIRTPMNAIIGFASLLRNVEDKEKIDKYSEIIIKSGNHLLTLVNDIIDISKIEAGQVSVMTTQLNLHKLLLELSMFFQSQIIAQHKNELKIVCEIDNQDFFIETDETRLRQILVNLIGNAIKFTTKGYVKFGYTILNEMLVFYVKDTGIGIPNEKFDLIFERFRQAADTNERFYGGAGLGLSISKACVEMLNGRMWLESEIGHGSTFYFSIRYTPVKTSLNVQETIVTQKLDFYGEHILIAEDDEVNFLYLVEIFKRYNIRVSRTKTGVETLDFIINNPDLRLVLMDIQMPEMNGWQVTRHLRKINNDISIIAQTAYAFDSDRLESINAGCNYFITKPTLAENLLNVVHAFLTKNKYKS